MILLTNDDGIDAPSLMALKKAIGRIDETVILAPDRNWSGSGHSITMRDMLRVDPITLPDGATGYKTTGTPADCVALALMGIFDTLPDMVISGINAGNNMGYDMFYSGTVAAAIEAVIKGVPSIAFSLAYCDTFPDYTPHARFAAYIVEHALSRGLPDGVMLNVNFPTSSWDDVKGVKVTRMGHSMYTDKLIRRVDPRGRPYYWIDGKPQTGLTEEDTDI